ncbi:uncharacterized protein MONBRDRAFT_32492 [Monosiga brevicollis MX1]|uniref:Aminotransferase class V domain-containing protein n=1 Tax=Monosiga brevicollis TaxID=81824 RepID=A9UZU8_MONBE|nr:uncharacterized protein MONBRDRAFT_32492 [Monosiga brevicollis MX1]EDQ89298.1 predicted protein [Monosiga brevicollis MX1]|eukprot:XP_001745874.1 hypothetical protein [Monosiga brevicollis MX1]
MERSTTTPEEPLIPVVPAYVTCGALTFLWHLLIAFLHLVGLGGSDPRNWSVKRPRNVVLSQSCRCIFALIWKNWLKPDDVVLISPFHHHSFIRMMRSTGNKLVVMDMDGQKLLPPKGYQAKDFAAVVVTQMLGRDYDAAWLKAWRAENKDLLIIEDRVQGDLISKEDETFADISLYSLGQDKIPNALGGGYGVVHNNPRLYDFLVREIEKLPFESAWERFSFILKKLPTLLIYNSRFGCFLVERLLRLFGYGRTAAVDNYRKQNPGFMHGGYFIRPSPALIRSIDIMGDLSRWEVMQERCNVQYSKFLDQIPKRHLDNVRVCGSDNSCCYFFVKLPDLDESRQLLANRGIMTINNQTFLPAEDKVAYHLDNMCTLPTFLTLTDEELDAIAHAMTECWDRFGHKVANPKA